MNSAYNITFFIEPEVEEDFLQYIKDFWFTALANSEATLLYFSYIEKPTQADSNDNTISYALFIKGTDEVLDNFISEYMPGLMEEMKERFGTKVLFFPTTMSLLYDGTDR